MNEIHINRAGQNLGVFTQAEVQAGLDSGKYLGTDLAWRAGMENWKPLAQWADFTIPSGVPPLVGVPILPSAGFVAAQEGDKNLPSWEQKAELGFFGAFGATVKEVLIEPSTTFARMKETGGYTTPFLYLLISTGIGSFLAFGVQFAMQGALGGMAASQNPEVAKMLATQSMGFGAGLLALLIILPIALFIGSFLNTALWHLSLMILGGANKPFEATYRVYSYASGSSALVSLVPCCGGLASLVWMIVSGSIGLSKVHGISVGKAVMAILLPLILCCGLCGVGIYFFIHAMSGNAEFMNAFQKALHP